MLSTRLTARCKTARIVGPGVLRKYRTCFGKAGRDGSGKASLVKAFDATAQGVLYSIEPMDAFILDAVEGSGYDRLDGCSVETRDGEMHTSFSYIAVSPKSDLIPLDWYMALVLAGAKEHDLPSSDLFRYPAQTDPDEKRQTRKEAITMLKAAGHTEWKKLLSDRNGTA